MNIELISPKDQRIVDFYKTQNNLASSYETGIVVSHKVQEDLEKILAEQISCEAIREGFSESVENLVGIYKRIRGVFGSTEHKIREVMQSFLDNGCQLKYSIVAFGPRHFFVKRSFPELFVEQAYLSQRKNTNISNMIITRGANKVFNLARPCLCVEMPYTLKKAVYSMVVTSNGIFSYDVNYFVIGENEIDTFKDSSEAVFKNLVTDSSKN